MTGKRKWSAVRAAGSWRAAESRTVLGAGDADSCAEIDAACMEVARQALASAYLAGIAAAGGPEATGEFLRAETERIERASKRGKDRT